MIEKSATLEEKNTLPINKMDNFDTTEKPEIRTRIFTPSENTGNNRYSKNEDIISERKSSTTVPDKMKRDSVRSSFKSYFSLKSVDDDYVSCKSSLSGSIDNLTDDAEKIVSDNCETRLDSDLIRESDNVRVKETYVNDETKENISIVDKIGNKQSESRLIENAVESDNVGLNKTFISDEAEESKHNVEVISHKNGNDEIDTQKTILENENNNIENIPTHLMEDTSDKAPLSNGFFVENIEKLAFTNQTFIEIEKLSRAVEQISLNKIPTETIQTVTETDTATLKTHSTENDIENIRNNIDKRLKLQNQTELENLNEIKVYVDDIVKESETKVASSNGTLNHVVNMNPTVGDQLFCSIIDQIAPSNEEYIDKLDEDNELSVRNRYKIASQQLEPFDGDEIVINIDEDDKTEACGEFQNVPLDDMLESKCDKTV